MYLLGIAGVSTAALLPLVTATVIPNSTNIYDLSDKWIISLKPEVNITNHMNMVEKLHTQDMYTFSGISHKYDFAGYRGYAGHFNKSLIDQMRQHEDVQVVEPDRMWTAARIVEQTTPNPGLGHISHRSPRTPRTYVFDDRATGAGTYAYIIDSGLNTRHDEFERRASSGFNGDPLNRPGDGSGHGTHAAGVIGSKSYGVAKRCRMIGVKVMHEDRTPAAIVLDGYQWAVKDIRRRGRVAKSVISISMTGPQSDAWVTAINFAFAKGITTIAAAGNDNRPADEFSPGDAKGAIVVGATDNSRTRARWSNYGPAISLFGPGVDIPSTWKGSRGATARMSGTSVAAAHVAGVVLYLKTLRKLPDSFIVKSHLLRDATTQSVGAANGSPNKFVYNGSGR
ncbi:subtilisin-like protein [Myriangium duriaei CBS 260.36]|uniref:Subtilisin-like protein n=1 Tax=Myriangium duriaei CBS 260.36 TaxID=1168546 RepID=A0A9P4J325_9PEZI|nr:subtilisin-like protein [Myriangium duriaei CBS 260.36]